MKTKKLHKRFYIVITFLLLSLVASSILMYRNYISITQSNERRCKSFALARELRNSSDELTAFSRNFVATGDSLWEKRYQDILDVRNGKRPWPNGSIISLQDSVKRLGFTDTEMALLAEAEHNSNLLAITEMRAINSVKKELMDASDEYALKGTLNAEMAAKTLFDSGYQDLKTSIITPVEQCVRLIENRTQQELTTKNRANRTLLIVNFTLIIVLLSVSFISIFMVGSRLTEQINQLKKAKDEAEKNQQRFTFLFNNSPDSVMVSSIEGILLDCNDTYLRFHGVETLDELKGIRINEFYTNPVDREELLQELRKYGYIRNKEIDYKSYKGRTISKILMSSELTLLQNGEIGILSWMRDITEKAEKEKTIREFSTAVEQSPGAIVITDLAGNIEYVNRQFTAITGYSAQEAIGQNPRVLNSGYHPKEFFENLWSTILSGDVWEGELYNKRKDGSYFWEEARISPVHNSQKQIVNIAAIKQDITLRKKAQDELIESEKKLQDLNNTKDVLFSIIGHDLRGPLGSIKGVLEILALDETVNQSQRVQSITKTLLSTASEAYDLLDNLLLWAKGQQKEAAFNPTDFEVYRVINTTISLMANMADTKKVTLHNLVPQGIIVHADKEMIMTVVRNLISNSIKFTNPDKNIYISVNEEDKQFTFSVKDEGVGISNTENLFDQTTTHTTFGTLGEKGTGLGLVLCKAFVEAHKGTIWVDSELGKGAEFKFTLPKLDH